MEPPSRRETRDERHARVARLQVQLYWTAAAILALGGIYSAWVYRSAAAADARSAAILAAARNTKSYEYQMETYGGKSNLLATEVHDWFVGLWQGQHLAHTVAVMTVALALLVVAAGYFLPDFPDSDEDGREGPGAGGR